MPLQSFLQDIKEAIRTPFDNVAKLRRGEVDNGLAFMLTHARLDKPIEVELAIQDVSMYRRDAKFMAFASSDDPAATDLCQSLEYFSSRLPGNGTVTDVVTLLSTRLAAKLSGVADDDDDDQAEDDQQVIAVELDEESEVDVDEDMYMKPQNTCACWSETVQRATAVGMTVAFYPADPQQELEAISLSLPVSLLGLPDDALDAWDINPSHHLVLYTRFVDGYPLLPEYLEQPTQQMCLEFYFGKCSSATPSYDAYGRLVSWTREKTTGTREPHVQDRRDLTTVDGPMCEPHPMTRSINRMLNHCLHRLLKQRRKRQVSWTAAQELLCKMDRNTADEAGPLHDAGDGAIICPQAPAGLQHDYALDADEQLSVPLVAMQLALRSLARCTEYCMACYRKIQGGFDSLKPYVCADPLCLHQYLALGFGPSIELEMIHRPYVVDLLVSFFYAAVLAGHFDSFPIGLYLRFVDFIDMNPAVALTHAGSRTLRLSGQQDCRVAQGAWFGLAMPSSGEEFADIEYAICRATDVQGEELLYETILQSYQVPSTVTTQVKAHLASLPSFYKPWKPVLAFFNTPDLDVLETDSYRQWAMQQIVWCIPSVLEMRNYLETHPGASLSSWSRINASTVILLQWILASNRSHIVQDQPLRPQDRTTTTGYQPPWYYLQFRFVQGAPDKEVQFVNQLNKYVLSDNNRDHKYPTLFAWHGSQFGNWHSIIRNGLNFGKVTNGRSFGDGVYMSTSMACSMRYAMGVQGAALGMSASGNAPTCWPNSVLRPSGAMSICEIINRPDMFVSQRPHYVVNKVEWIQCRYLYVSVCPSPESLSNGFRGGETKRPGGFISQEPAREIIDMNNNVFEVPLSAIPALRRQLIEPAKSSQVPLSTVASTVASNGFRAGSLDFASLPRMPEPSWTASSPQALAVLSRELKELHQTQAKTATAELGWYIDVARIDNMFQWIVELHSFDASLPLARDMARAGSSSVVLEVRFGSNYPFSPPFVRVIRPRFVPFLRGGGGHVTAGGAICSEMLTSTGWSPVLGMDKVFLQIRLGLCEVDPPARLDAFLAGRDYGYAEAVDAYLRAARTHEWQVPADFGQLSQG